MDAKAFVKAGNALFTLEVPERTKEALLDKEGVECKPHYTFKIRCKNGDNPVWFVSLLTGPNNTNWQDFSYVGLFDPSDYSVRLTAKSKYNRTTVPVRLLRMVLARIKCELDLPEGFVIHHEGRCCRCGRVLTVPQSVESGIGPECATKI